MSNWEVVRHAVAITGRVGNAQTGRSIGSAMVVITDAPTEFSEWLKIKARQFGTRWHAMLERPDRTRTAADGHFHFMDLPAGSYTLVATMPGEGSRYGQAEEEVTVSQGAEGNLIMATANIQLPPTTLKGTIATQGTGGAVPVILAKVKVSGSGEKAFSDDKGDYLLMGLEKGLRTVLISAKGYQPESRIVDIDTAGVEKVLDITLAEAQP